MYTHLVKEFVILTVIICLSKFCEAIVDVDAYLGV